MIGDRHYFATVGAGLEGLLAEELAALGAAACRPGRGGVAFEGPLSLAYRVCLWSRLANRVLMPLAQATITDEAGLYAAARDVDWPAQLGPDNTIAVDFGGVRPVVSHTRFGAFKVKDAIVDALRDATGSRPSVDTDRPDIRINAFLHHQALTLSLDLSGESLHRRGYRVVGTPAPLKENLAAAILLRAGWPEIAAAGGALLDPMCGSGTLPIEAAWMAGDVAPGLLRTHFGFHAWRGHDDAAWKALLDEAMERQETGLRHLPPIVGHDQDAEAVRLAIGNVERAGLRGHVHIERRELARAEPVGNRGGLVVVNPPYGERLQRHESVAPLYTRLGEVLRSRFAGWQAVVLTGAEARIGLRPERSWQLRNGPIRCRLDRFVLHPEPAQAADDADDAAVALVNRLHKNARRLKSWLKQSGTTCYRLYDADIPEFALAVDVYETDEEGRWLHVQEYAAPSSVAAEDAARRLRIALASLPRALEVPAERVAFKVRRRQKGTTQYQRQGNTGRLLTVREGEVHLRVNLTDYLDTGVFLDHRVVRRYIGEQAAGLRFLNLFCYTAAATAHAAVGGAAETTSVDLSRTYLDWARENLRSNGVANHDRHRLIRADCLTWMTEAASGGEGRYDLILLDPPSFSNSKRMEATLDIQRDHAALVDAAMRLLARNGELLFSCNLRRFRLDGSLAERYRVEDRSRWSIPPDFARNARIHQCFSLRHREDGPP